MDRMKRGLSLTAALVGLAAAAAGCREHGRPDPQIRMAVAHDVEEPQSGSPQGVPEQGAPPQAGGSPGAPGAGQGGVAAPNRLEVPP